MTEHQEQCAVIRWARSHPDARLRNLFAIPNGGARTKAGARQLKNAGVAAGVPDLLLAFPAFTGVADAHGLFVEMKTPRGRVSAEQSRWRRWLLAAGYSVVVCRSASEAIEAIEDYLGIGGGDE
jgi:hypothetical protein